LSLFEHGDLKLLFGPEVSKQSRLRETQLLGETAYGELTEARNAGGSECGLDNPLAGVGAFVHSVCF
jgi:hypothetical protein